MVNLRHKKELENMHNPQHMVDLSSQSTLGKRSASLSMYFQVLANHIVENDAAGEAMLTPTLVDYVNSPGTYLLEIFLNRKDKKRQKKLRPDIDITEPVQLPVRLRLVNKGRGYSIHILYCRNRVLVYFRNGGCRPRSKKYSVRKCGWKWSSFGKQEISW